MWRRTLLLCLLLALTTNACTVIPAAWVSSAPTPTIEYAIYVVQPGDTLSHIALRYGMTVEQLIALNRDTYPSLARDPSSLRAGWQLRVTTATSGTADVSVTPRFDANEVAQEIIEQINAARAQRGLLLLRPDVTLIRIAKERSEDMITRAYFSHYDPATGQEPLLRYLQAAKFTYRYAGENIAEVKNDAGWVPPWLTVAARYGAHELANEFVKGWLNSPEHRANIFNGHYRRTGVALAVSKDGRRIVATQVFAD
ncbi:MAG: CAP domain-containing protein [Anaerolineae bacterium]|nr:CAP domain-containing protein [Anaerolineae bacterium]